MSSRKWIGTVLITLVVVTVLAAGGYALYRYGYARGAIAANVGDGFMPHDLEMPFMGGHMGQGYMFHNEDMPYMDGHMGEGHMFHDFEGMPFPGGRMGEMPEGFQGQFNTPNRGVGSHGVPFGRTPLMHSFASPLTFILWVFFLGLLVWAFYKFIKLFTGGKSWQLSFNSQVEAEPEVEAKPKGRAKNS